MSLDGKIVCFTGKLSKSRDEMIEEAKAAGLETRTSMSVKVDYLVAGDQIAYNAENTKYKEAVELDIEVLSESEYRKKLGNTEAKPKKAKAEAKPKKEKAEAKPKKEKAEAKPKKAKAEAKPKKEKAEAKPKKKAPAKKKTTTKKKSTKKKDD